MMAKGNELKSQIIKGIHASSRTTSPQSAFRNWCEAMALALQNACLLPGTPRWKANEEAYQSILKSVGNDTMLRFREMFELYQELLTVSPFHDWLGQIYMELGGDSNKGQFFTPYNISQACAQLVCDAPDGDEPITICEPSCGSGGMIIATLEAMDKKHIKWQKRVRIEASDIDTLCVHMCYVTMSLLGVRAKVLHQNTLTLETWSIWYTPRWVLWPIMDYGGKPEQTETEQNASECVQIATAAVESRKADENTSKTENAPKRKSEPIQMSLF